MANTWNKIKNKFKWKKGPSRRSRNRRKKPKKSSRPPPEPHPHPHPHRRHPHPKRSNAPTTVANHITKKKQTKSNLFGCFTAIPKEYTQSNLDQPPQTPNVSKTNHFSNLIPPPSPSSASASAPMKPLNPIHIPPTNDSLAPSPFDTRPPCSPSKSKTETPCFANPTSSKFIHDNPSMHSVYSDHPPTLSCIKYNMTPTPHTFTELDYDIYEGVLEVEDDNIIDEYYHYYGDAYDSRVEEEDDDMKSDIIKSPHSVEQMTTFGCVNRDRASMNHSPPYHDDEDEFLLGDEDHFMEQLNAELIRNGYENPQRLLNELWTEQMEMDRGAQMYKIWQYMCDNNKMMEDLPPMEDMEDEDDDIKLEFTPQHAYAYPCHDTPHPHPILPPMEHPHPCHHHVQPQYHEGPLRVTMESGSIPKSPTCESQPSVLSGTDTANHNDNKRLQSGSSLGDELEYLDGEVFHNKYVIGRKINEGGFGSVWKINDHRIVPKCVKIMELGKDQESQTRRRKACIREYNMTRKAFSDEIIEVELYIDRLAIPGAMPIPQAYLIMPYFEGKDLFEFIDDDEYFRKVSTNTMLHIFYKIAEKLYDLHYFKKIVHGDLKPENVMILQSSKSDDIEVEIIDYGIAKSIRNLSSDAKYLKSKGHFGTKGYVAPELMRESKYNRKIDVFSAGVVLYNMVTECCLFPKGHKYYRLSEAEYYKYLKKKFKCIKKKKMVMNILYSCLAYDPDERLDVKQLIERYFHSKR